MKDESQNIEFIKFTRIHFDGIETCANKFTFLRVSFDCVVFVHFSGESFLFSSSFLSQLARTGCYGYMGIGGEL